MIILKIINDVVTPSNACSSCKGKPKQKTFANVLLKIFFYIF